jgi:hypothetical protein
MRPGFYTSSPPTLYADPDGGHSLPAEDEHRFANGLSGMPVRS